MELSKFEIFGIGALAVGVVGLTIMYLIIGPLWIDQNKADHYQSGINELNTYTNKDCSMLSDYLSKAYKEDPNDTPDWNHYLGLAYDKAKELGCSPLPEKIERFNP